MNNMRDEKDEYIEYLENKIIEMSQDNQYNQRNGEANSNNLIRYQEEFLLQKYCDKDYWMYENKTLHEENIKLLKTIMFNQTYINYLLNSYWWKATYPFRFISRNIKGKKISKGRYVEVLTNDSVVDTLQIKVSIVIFTKNPGEEFNIQLNNIKKQEYIKDIEIIVADRNSDDNTLNIAEKHNVKVVKLDDMDLSNRKGYLKIFPMLSGDYIVVMDQNKIVNSKYWLYQSIKPIYDGKASLTAFLKKDATIVREATVYEDLKNRMEKIANQQVIFFPMSRNIIQYINPFILDKAEIIVEKIKDQEETEGV